MVENNNIFISGFGAYIKSTNNGEDWLIKRNISEITGLWYSIFFINPSSGWMSTNGIIIKTTDGRTSWLEQNPNTTDQIYDLQFFDLQDGIAITDQGKRVLHTTNGGTVWQVKKSTINKFSRMWFLC